MKFQESRKEDELYYQGAFWLIADSFKDILRGNFKLEGIKLLSNYEGDLVNYSGSKKGLTHQRLWRDSFGKDYPEKSYTYFPRGRVAIYEGTTFIHLNSKCNTPKVIDTIIKEYNLSKLEIELDLNDTYQGSHYDFELK